MPKRRELTFEAAFPALQSHRKPVAARKGLDPTCTIPEIGCLTRRDPEIIAGFLPLPGGVGRKNFLEK